MNYRNTHQQLHVPSKLKQRHIKIKRRFGQHDLRIAKIVCPHITDMIRFGKHARRNETEVVRCEKSAHGSYERVAVHFNRVVEILVKEFVQHK